MPFSFYVSKPIVNNFGLKEKDIPEVIKNNTNYFVLIFKLSQYYFPTLLIVPESILLLEYVKKILSVDYDSPLIMEHLLEIQQQYKSLLSIQNIEILIEVLLVARNIVIKADQKRCDTAAQQIEHMRLVQKRLSIMIQVLGILPDDFYENKGFLISRSDFLVALCTDACSQLKNIGEGLYYSEYIQNFEELTNWFLSNWNITATIFSRLTHRLRTTGMPQSELQNVLPLFALSMERVRYAAAFYFANGDNERGEQLLKESAEYNVESQLVFKAVHSKGAGLLEYNSIIDRHNENEEGLGLETPLSEYRKLCFATLKAIQIFDKQSQENNSNFLNENALKKCIKNLNKISKIDAKSSPVLAQVFELLHVMSLLKYGSELIYVKPAKAIIEKLNNIFESQKSNITLIKVQACLLRYTNKMQICVEEIQAELESQKKLLQTLKKTLIEKTYIQEKPQEEKKAKPTKPSRKNQTSEDFEKKLESVSQHLTKTSTRLEAVKKELAKATNQHKSVSEKLRGRKRKEQKFQEQIEQLRKNIILAKEKNAILKEKEKDLLASLPELNVKDEVNVLEKEIAVQKKAHEAEIQTLTSGYEKSPKQLKQEAQLKQMQEQLKILQLKLIADAKQHQIKVDGIKTQYTGELEKQEQEAHTLLESLQAQKKLVSDQLLTLGVKTQACSEKHKDTIAQLKSHHAAEFNKLAKPYLLKGQGESVSQCQDQLHLAQAQNQKLRFELEALQKLTQEQEKQQQQQQQQQNELMCSRHSTQKQVFTTIIETLQSAVTQRQKQLAGSQVCMRITDPSLFEFSTNLAEKLKEDSSLVTECLSLYVQLNKPFDEKDYKILYESLPNLLLSKELKCYLAVFCAIVNHVIPLYGFKKVYNGNMLSQLVPFDWPQNPQIIQDWLKFVEMRFTTMHFPVDPYFVFNLILIAPYYALAEKIPSVSKEQIIQEIANTLIQALPNIEDAEKYVFQMHIQSGLNESLMYFQSWVLSRFKEMCDAVAMRPAPILPSIPSVAVEPQVQVVKTRYSHEKKRG